MRVGVGLPTAAPGVRAEQLVEFARRADALGFSSLGAIDRLVYANFEPLIALASAASVTTRIELLTSVVLGPLRTNPVELAKQARTLNAISSGRLTLGVGLGAREDDYVISGVDTTERGRRLDETLGRLKEIWAGDEIGPFDEDAPGLIVGGHVEASFARAARYADGWISGGAPPEAYSGMVESLNAAWAEAGRTDAPRTMALLYYSLGEDSEARARSFLAPYHAFLDAETVEDIIRHTPTDPEGVRASLAAFADARCGELVLFPCSSDPEQVNLLAEAAGL